MYDKKHLNLLREIAITQFKLKDQSTFWGFVWSFFHPLLMLAVLFIFFRSRAGQGIDHYAVYLLIGIIQYAHFSNSTSASMYILSSMKNLTCNTIFPKEILVIGSVISNTVEFVLSMLICIVIASIDGVNISWAVMMLPFVIVSQIMLVLWVSLILSCVYVFARDINHIYQVFLRILFFITPIFYDISFLGDGIARYIALLNPLTHLIQFTRTILIEGRPVSLELWSIFFLANTVLIFLGFKIFRKYEPAFAEHV